MSWTKRKQLFSFMVLALAPLTAEAATDVALAPGIKLYETRRYEEARNFLESYAARNPKSADADSYLGRTFVALKKYETGADWLTKAAALAPGQSAIQLWLGRAYGRAIQDASVFKQPGLASRAKDAWEKAIALDPDNLDARDDLVQFYLKAPGVLGGSVDKAREQATEIKKRDLYKGTLASVSVDQHEKDFAAVERGLKETIQKLPAEPRLRIALANFYQSQQKWDASFEVLEAALKTHADSWDALYLMGRGGSISGQRLDRAEECLKRYLGHTPSAEEPPLANAHFRLGLVYQKQGKKPQARTEYQTALRLDPNLKDAKEALAHLG
jgi:tetratricopeptide (TPR) repeat protein